jgi:hypothetical protein
MIEHNLFAGLLIVLVDGTSHVINIIGKVPSRSIKIWIVEYYNNLNLLQEHIRDICKAVCNWMNFWIFEYI